MVDQRETRPMDVKTENLTPASELARNNPVRMPNESADYRAARSALLAEEIDAISSASPLNDEPCRLAVR